MNSKIILLILSILSILSFVYAKNRVMPWMCLERCGDTQSQIVQQLDDISNNKLYLSAVSFELYNLGPQSTLVVNNFTNVLPYIKSTGLESYAMISSYPYPPDFLDWMHQLFQNPQPFIDTCIKEAQTRGFTGFNVDFEPTTTATNQDAQDYANFLTKFANALHQVGKKLTVDAATWNPIWNYTLLGQTSVDRICIMSTYTNNDSSFLKNLDLAVSQIPLSKLGIGIENDWDPQLTEDQVELRFTSTQQAGVNEIDIWKMPMPSSFWWDQIQTYSLSN
eukprot:TRINITY_DN104_c3_g2_i1.p1 TRINITY_DN104_c3_g2~~TRINITY_DN104_c3_g2_i1.p1  ORF type:complete len:278 (-),score=129.90 TRINITY_DN104_c3_g2_i1:153-986(-)